MKTKNGNCKPGIDNAIVNFFPPAAGAAAAAVGAAPAAGASVGAAAAGAAGAWVGAAAGAAGAGLAGALHAPTNITNTTIKLSKTRFFRVMGVSLLLDGDWRLVAFPTDLISVDFLHLPPARRLLNGKDFLR